MPENYICKDCNYASDVAGLCPHCDMPLEPLDPTKIDPNTGETYKTEDMNVKGELPPLPKDREDEDDEFIVEEEELKEDPIDEDE